MSQMGSVEVVLIVLAARGMSMGTKPRSTVWSEDYVSCAYGVSYYLLPRWQWQR